ncbi:MAG: YcxB family protein [Pseudomonadota bacterium]
MSGPVLTVEGQLLDKDIKKLARASRTSVVGPTALYYAGVTAPIISAGMALVVKNALTMLGATSYWQLMLSAIIAAFAGIVWYLIFMRWSYRHKVGRGNELSDVSNVRLEDDALILTRGPVETRIASSGLKEVVEKRGFTIVRFEGVDPLIIPDRWFAKDKQARKAFLAQLKRI